MCIYIYIYIYWNRDRRDFLFSPPNRHTTRNTTMTIQHDTTRHNTPHTTRHDTTRHDTTRHDTTRHDTTRHDTTRHDTTRHDTTRHDTTRHDTTRHDTTRHDTTRHDTTRHDTTRQHTTQPHHNNNNTIWRLHFYRRGASTQLCRVESCSLPSRWPCQIPATPPYVFKTPHLHGAATTEETSFVKP